MNCDKGLEELNKGKPPAPRTDPAMCEFREDLERRNGGALYPDGRLATVNFADGNVYHLAEYPNSITPQFARAILRHAGL